MVLKKILLFGLVLIGMAAVAVLLFYAGDHDEEYRQLPVGAPQR